jgi:hypothetical protein
MPSVTNGSNTTTNNTSAGAKNTGTGAVATNNTGTGTGTGAGATTSTSTKTGGATYTGNGAGATSTKATTHPPRIMQPFQGDSAPKHSGRRDGAIHDSRCYRYDPAECLLAAAIHVLLQAGHFEIRIDLLVGLDQSPCVRSQSSAVRSRRHAGRVFPGGMILHRREAPGSPVVPPIGRRHGRFFLQIASLGFCCLQCQGGPGTVN